MKKSIWSKNLYFEGLRRLRGLIITFAVLSFAASAILAVISLIKYNGIRETSDGYIFAVPGLLFVFTGAPALASRTFSFLNKRKGSDMFHALPYTRTCVFLSFLSSLLTAITAITAFIAVIGSVAYAVSGAIPGATKLFFMMILACYIASLYVSAVIIMTVTASGSAFTETVISIVLIIFPQVIIAAFYSYIISNVPTAVMTDVYRIINSSGDLYFLGLPLRLLFTFLGGYGTDGAYVPLPYIYTSVACLLYFAAAYLLFRYRKSETAERSAPSAAFQAVFRVIVTCAFSFIGILLLSSGFDGNADIKSILPGVILFFGLATVSYFIFELISSKGKKNLLKTLPTLAAVAALNFAFLGALYGIYTYEMKFGTKPDKVSAVTVSKNAVGNYDNADYDLTDLAYGRILLKGYRIKNTETVAEVCREIEYVNENWTGGKRGFLVFNIRCGIAARKRSMNVFSDLETLIKDEINETEEYKKLLKNLPEHLKETEKLYHAGVFVNSHNETYASYSQDNVDKVLDALKKELPLIDFDKWEQLITKAGITGGDARIRYLTEYGYLTVPLSEELTPEAYRLAYEIVTK